jgi:hypothetical protein
MSSGAVYLSNHSPGARLDYKAGRKNAQNTVSAFDLLADLRLGGVAAV